MYDNLARMRHLIKNRLKAAIRSPKRSNGALE